MAESPPISPGGAPAFGPRGAAVITPYHRESLELLQRCHQSCLNQAHPVRHVMVADGPRVPNWMGGRSIIWCCRTSTPTTATRRAVRVRCLR